VPGAVHLSLEKTGWRKGPILRGVKAFLASTVGKKVAMGITGLLLCGFLIVHLAGNLLLYVGDDTYNRYAHALHSNEHLVKAAEIGLVVVFVAHVGLAIGTTRENRAARKIRYEQRKSKRVDRIISSLVSADGWMFLSGTVVLLFLLLHLADFTFEQRMQDQIRGKEPFEKAQILLADGLSGPVYLIGSIILGFHLAHGVASAFQSLGMSHPKYDPIIKWGSAIFAILMALGFASFPIWALG